MAKKGFFGRLIEKAKEGISRLFGRNKSKVTKEVHELPQEPAHEPSVDYWSTPTREPSSQLVDYLTEPTSEPDYSNDPEYSRQSSHAYWEFQNFKSQYEDLISDANRRWELIEAQGLSSMAISRAKEETGRDYFSLDFADTKEEVIEEVTRAYVFMADKTSTIEGAELYTAEINSERFRGKFGKQYRTPEYNNKGFDTNIINEEYAKEVFRAYRNLESLEQGLIKEYGSENLIIAMYDAKVRGADPFMAGLHLIETWYKTKSTEWQSRFDEAQAEYERFNREPHGTVFDYIEGGDLDDDSNMYF